MAPGQNWWHDNSGLSVPVCWSQYGNQTGSGMQAVEDCLMCGAGLYQDTEGSVDCKSCATGTYQTGSGMETADDCTECVAGRYQPLTGQVSSDACLLCPSDTFQTLTGQVSIAACHACSAHSHSPNGSALQTDYVCAPGYEGANGGTCAQCNSSTWCMSGTANLCPAHSLAAEGSSALTSCLCVPGYFGDAVDPTPCALCLDDYYCPGGAVDLSLACQWGRYSLPGAAAASSCFCPGNASSGPGADSMWSCTCDPHFKQVDDPLSASEWSCEHCVAGEPQ